MPDLAGSAGAYALVGMATVSAATMHAPITSILILFELTNDYRIILPLMMAVIISTVIKMHLKKESMYSLKLIRKGLDIEQKGEPNVLSKIKVKKIINQGCLTVLADTPFTDLHELTKKSINLNYFVVDENKKLIGILSPHKIRTIENQRDLENIDLKAKDLIVEKGIFFTPEDTLDKVGLMLNDLVLDEIPIVNNEQDQIVIGYISKTEVINAYNREMAKTDMLNSVSAYIGSVGKFRQLKMVNGEVLCEVEVPGKYVDKNLAELDLRHKYGIEVILIKQNYDPETNESEKVFVPNPEYRFAYGDKLLIVGSQEEVDLFNQ